MEKREEDHINNQYININELTLSMNVIQTLLTTSIVVFKQTDWQALSIFE